MRRITTFLVGAVLSSQILANEAIEEANYEFGANAQEYATDPADATIRGYGLAATARLPVAAALGLVLEGRADTSSVESDSIPNLDCSGMAGYLGAAQLFVRDSGRGKLGLSHSRESAQGCRTTIYSPPGGPTTTTTEKTAHSFDTTTLVAEAYLGMVTVGASHSQLKFSSSMTDSTDYASLLYAGWYPDNHTFLSFSTTGLDQEKDGGTLKMESQPGWFPEGEWSVSYSNDYEYQHRQWNLGTRYRNYGVSLGYRTIADNGHEWQLNFTYFLQRYTDLLTRHRRLE